MFGKVVSERRAVSGTLDHTKRVLLFGEHGKPEFMGGATLGVEERAIKNNSRLASSRLDPRRHWWNIWIYLK